MGRRYIIRYLIRYLWTGATSFVSRDLVLLPVAELFVPVHDDVDGRWRVSQRFMRLHGNEPSAVPASQYSPITLMFSNADGIYDTDTVSTCDALT